MQTDLTKLIVIFRNFVNAPDKLLEIFVVLRALYSTPEYMMHPHFRGNILGNKPARCADYQNCANTLSLSRCAWHLNRRSLGCDHYYRYELWMVQG
jgi:hypothetical protein